MNTLYQEALALHQQQQFAAAEKKYKEYLHLRSDDTEAWLNLGILYYQTDDYQEAQGAISKSLEIEALNAQAYYVLGCCLEKSNKIPQAISAYQDAIALDPNLLDAYNNLGNIIARLGQITQAETVYRQAISANPSHFGSYINLGNLLIGQNQIEQAIELYQTALTFNPDNPNLLNNLEVALDIQKNSERHILESGYRLYQEGRYEDAIAQYKKYLETQTGNNEVYFCLSECFKYLNQEEEAISTLEEGIRLYPTAGKLHFSLITILHVSGRSQAAISSAETASRLLPNDYAFKLLKNLLLPILYDTPDEISFYRQRYEKELQNLIQETSLETPEDKSNALAGIGCVTTFYLAYQAKNLLELQSQYGNLVHRIMTANYPNWVQPLSMPPLKQNNKIRVGYVSAYLHSYSGSLWLVGWLRNCDKQHFEIYCYYTGNEPDYITQQFKKYSDLFHHIPNNMEKVCQQIISDRLHILLFPEIGMDPPTIQMAGLRLAPIQCTAWGHPVTSGLPTIDYYLSSELMEPENAQEHYSETLITLPNLAVSYPKPNVPELTKKRSDFQMRDDAIVYLCCQAPFKYLPQHDFIFAEIARCVPQAQFVFFPRSSPHLKNRFQQRLQRAFAAVNLNSEDYCVFLPLQHRNDYLTINLLSDVYLDSLGFSGGNTTLDAVACNLPVVTRPGEFMRDRISYAILKMLGVSDTIAPNEAEYIEIAVKLGLDPVWRRDIAERIKARQDYVYDDKACVKALEDFYRQVVQQ